jgi:hypothetical protein
MAAVEEKNSVCLAVIAATKVATWRDAWGFQNAAAGWTAPRSGLRRMHCHAKRLRQQARRLLRLSASLADAAQVGPSGPATIFVFFVAHLVFSRVS